MKTTPSIDTRAPNQPTTATVVEGDNYAVQLIRRAPGNVVFELWIDGNRAAHAPFDNLVKACTRVDPDNAVGAEKQIAELRMQLAKARSEAYEWQYKVLQLEALLAKP